MDGRKFEFTRAQVLELKFPLEKDFVGGVNPKLFEEKSREYFGTFGLTDNIELPVCPRTNRSGFLFITYTDDTPVRRLLETRYHLIGSRWCEAKIAMGNESWKPQLKGGGDVPFPRLGNHWEGGEFPTNSNVCGVNQNVCGTIRDVRNPFMILV